MKRCARRSFDEAVSSVPVNRRDQSSKYKKNDKSNTNSVQSSANKNGEVAIDLKKLSQLTGAFFWCDSSAKIELRS